MRKRGGAMGLFKDLLRHAQNFYVDGHQNRVYHELKTQAVWNISVCYCLHDHGHVSEEEASCIGIFPRKI